MCQRWRPFSRMQVPPQLLLCSGMRALLCSAPHTDLVLGARVSGFSGMPILLFGYPTALWPRPDGYAHDASGATRRAGGSDHQQPQES